MLSRHIGAMLRGEATTAQVYGAAILGAMLGFIPGFSNGAGLMVLLIAALVILNVSVPFALLVFALAKLVSLLILPVSFALGRGIVDGPLQPLFRCRNRKRNLGEVAVRAQACRSDHRT